MSEMNFFFGEGKKRKSPSSHQTGPRAAYTCKVCGEVGHNARRHSSGSEEGSTPKKGEQAFRFGG